MRRVAIYSIILATCSLFFISCAAGSRSRTPSRVRISDYIDLESFCKKYHFKYDLDTIDDIVRIYSQDKEIKILLNSLVASSDGSIFYLKAPPVYLKGKITIPRQLEKLVSSKKLVSFRPLFTVKTIVIDPGHGGKDPGAISPRGLKEKTVNLSIAKYLKTKLEREGFKVILTRDNDSYPTLQKRVNIAKKNKADLFISVHTNSNRSSKVSGAEIYYLSPSRLNSSARAAKLAKTENFQGKVMPFDVKAILWDLLITKNYSSSVELSNSLYFNFKNLGFKVKPPKKAPFYVLRFAYTPSVLVETGYLSNHYEEKALRKKHYQKQIAESIALSITSLKKRYAK